jgi:hypothetical protein
LKGTAINGKKITYVRVSRTVAWRFPTSRRTHCQPDQAFFKVCTCACLGISSKGLRLRLYYGPKLSMK